MKFLTNMVPLALSAALLLLAGCRSAPEAIPSSDKIAVSPTKAAPSQPASPPVPTPISSSPLRMPQVEQRIETLYRANSSGDELLFALDYDVAQWKYLTGGPYPPSLGHQVIPFCSLWLGAGAQGEEIDTVRLAGKDWLILRSESSEQLHYQSSPYGFSVYLHPTGDPAIEGRLEMCQRAAEEVINSFRPISAYPAEYFEQSLGAIEPSTLDVEGWPTYTSEQGGYSLRYPDGWTVKEWQYGSLSITHPFGLYPDKISVGYDRYEKPEAEDLTTWAKSVAILGPGPPYLEDRIYSEISLDVEDPNRPSQIVYMRDAIVSGHGYLIPNRRLVLQIYTTTETKDVTEQLAAVASSVTFSTDGPANQKALHFPDDPPVDTLLEEYLQRMDEISVAVEAVNYRQQTGEVANRLLDGMSEHARERYERLLADSTEHITETDRRRGMPVSPLLLPTSNPETFGEEFHEQERIYNEGLKNSDPKASDSPLPLPTTTP